MITIITGPSHSGKTLLAGKLAMETGALALSIDLLKMGLIRSNHVNLTPEDDTELEIVLWPIVAEMIKTAIENRQNLIVEGCYIPEIWSESFEDKYKQNIDAFCIVMSEKYIAEHLEDIYAFSRVSERREAQSAPTKDDLIEEHARYRRACELKAFTCLHIDDKYDIERLYEEIAKANAVESL